MDDWDRVVHLSVTRGKYAALEGVFLEVGTGQTRPLISRNFDILPRVTSLVGVAYLAGTRVELLLARVRI